MLPSVFGICAPELRINYSLVLCADVTFIVNKKILKKKICGKKDIPNFIVSLYVSSLYGRINRLDWSVSVCINLTLLKYSTIRYGYWVNLLGTALRTICPRGCMKYKHFWIIQFSGESCSVWNLGVIAQRHLEFQTSATSNCEISGNEQWISKQKGSKPSHSRTARVTDWTLHRIFLR